MATYQYQARDCSSGAVCTGAMTAASGEEARQMLMADGKAVDWVRQEFAPPASNAKKIKTDDVIFFATQLAVMVDTGVPLTDALDAMSEQTLHPGMKAMVTDISQEVKGGVEFSTVLGKYEKTFGQLFISLMQASEASGRMGEMLQRASRYLEAERETRRRVKGAMIYPACMLSFCVVTITALLAFVLPRFENIYTSKGASLPAPTQVLVSASNLLVNWWPLILLGVAGAVTGVILYRRTPGGRQFFDRLQINMPIIGPMYRKSYLARSLRTMATMVTSGVDILDGLDITARVAGNYYYARIWNRVADRVTEGSALSEELFSCPEVPRTVAQMISAGEKTGQLGPVMDRIAAFCEEDLKTAIKATTQLIEPAMIITMGILIGGIAIALLLPIFSISKVMTH